MADAGEGNAVVFRGRVNLPSLAAAPRSEPPRLLPRTVRRSSATTLGVIVAGMLVVAGCGLGTQQALTVCPPELRAPLYSGLLVEMQPSATSFVVQPKVHVWASTTNQSRNIIFNINSAGELDAFLAGSSPRVVPFGAGYSSDDPNVTLKETGDWYRLPVGTGTWRVYTTDTEGSSVLNVTVVGCAP